MRFESRQNDIARHHWEAVVLELFYGWAPMTMLCTGFSGRGWCMGRGGGKEGAGVVHERAVSRDLLHEPFTSNLHCLAARQALPQNMDA